MPTFKVDDKIFGKVKGYSAWPAKITRVNGKRYDVVFYGTNETATLKPENIEYYLQSKQKYTNLLKRKYFNEAIVDIEEDIKSCGGADGSPNEELPINVINKRKRRTASAASSKRLKVTKQNGSQESDTSTTSSAQLELTQSSFNELHIDKETDMNSTPTTSSTSEETEMDSKSSDDNQIRLRGNVPSTIPEVTEVDEISTQCVSQSETIDVEVSSLSLDESSIDMSNICLLPPFFLPAVITYAKKVKDNASFYTSISPDPSSIYDANDTRAKILPVRLAENRYVGLIYEEKDVNNFTSEYERALDDLDVVESIFKLQTQLESSSQTDLESRGIKVVYELNCDDEYVKTSTQNALIAYKKAKLQWLRTELLFFKTICDVKKCLRRSQADTSKALDLLTSIHDMPITRITLKKRPTLIDTIVKLTKYVGRSSQWQLNAEEKQQFEKNATKIRCIANAIYAKVKTLFDYQNTDFPTYFRSVCSDFFDMAKDMTDMDMFSLCAEPYSRRASIELVYDAQATTE